MFRFWEASKAQSGAAGRAWDGSGVRSASSWAWWQADSMTWPWLVAVAVARGLAVATHTAVAALGPETGHTRVPQLVLGQDGRCLSLGPGWEVSPPVCQGEAPGRAYGAKLH